MHLARGVEQPSHGTRSAGGQSASRLKARSAPRWRNGLSISVTVLVAEQHHILAGSFNALLAVARHSSTQRRRSYHPHQFPARVLAPGRVDQLVRFLLSMAASF